jgi:endonuclease-3
MTDAAASLTRKSPKALRAPVIKAKLDEAYGGGHIELNFSNPFELLIATILSAQATDKKINEVTETLFAKYRSPADYLAVPEEELQADLYQTGFFRQKTKSIRGVSGALLERFNGEVPLRMADLITLPGVARKTANVVLSAAAPAAHLADRDAGIAVDTHVQRLSKRFAFTRHADPAKIERDLMKLYPKREWPDVSLVFILHGRRTCDALRPRCVVCPVEQLCPSSLAAGRRDLAGQAKGMGRVDPAELGTQQTAPPQVQGYGGSNESRSDQQPGD